ncbi:MAG: hypothetical protein BWY99_02140 [Synergistetes bacterium ADurb.BinA166]|nr:MAG: hypothetical protein BWY99_02140 [Synergistetes bacterium ADurb.BinA166]
MNRKELAAAMAASGDAVGLVAGPEWGALTAARRVWPQARRCKVRGLHTLAPGDRAYEDCVLVPDFDTVPPASRTEALRQARSVGLPVVIRSRTEDGLEGLGLPVLRLMPMTREETAALVRETDEKEGRRTTAEETSALFELADGHPLWTVFAHRCLHLHGEEGRLDALRSALTPEGLSGRKSRPAPAPVQQAVAKVLNPLHQTAELLVAAEDVALGLRDCMELRADLRREMVVHGALIGEAGRKGPTMPSFVQKPLWHLARLRRGLT